jgi:hypothetical protein
MIDVPSILQLHELTVAGWHERPVDNIYDGFLALVCRQHGFNFLLWHEEDIARSPNVGDTRIAEVKRAIDRYNQDRNNAIEKLDDWITEDLVRHQVAPTADARLNTETPGSVIDRLSILSLRIYHLAEQAQRDDATSEHRQGAAQKLAVCRLQRAELSQSLVELLEDIYTGKKRHRTYRALKMYNDPALNPYLYETPHPGGVGVLSQA